MIEIDEEVLYDAVQLLRLLANETDPHEGTREFARFTADVLQRRIEEQGEV